MALYAFSHFIVYIVKVDSIRLAVHIQVRMDFHPLLFLLNYRIAKF